MWENRKFSGIGLVKGLRRWLFNGVAALSLMLCVVSVGLWVRSYWRQDAIPFLARPLSTCFLADWRGHLELTRQYVTPAMPSGWGASTSNYGSVGVFRQGGGVSGGAGCDPHLMAPDAFYFGHTVGLGTTIISPHQLFLGFEVWAAPFWVIVMLFAILPVFLALRKLRASRRYVCGLCASCGYDLRATPDRCPECGTVAIQREILN
jgi:hypothetical protein